MAAAVLLLHAADPPGSGTYTRSNHIFAIAALLVRWWHGHLFGWVWRGSRAPEFLTILPLNGAAWSLGLAVLARRLRRSARARQIALGSALAGTTLAVLVCIVGMAIMGKWYGPDGLILLAQMPGAMLLAMNGYDSYLYDGTFVDEIYRPGPLTLFLFSFANALLIAPLALVAGFTWRWMRTPLPPRTHVEQS